eukprot:COSAG05_NODE_4069_length_1688_cov_5.717432_2_plen_187_part_00
MHARTLFLSCAVVLAHYDYGWYGLMSTLHCTLTHDVYDIYGLARERVQVNSLKALADEYKSQYLHPHHHHHRRHRRRRHRRGRDPMQQQQQQLKLYAVRSHMRESGCNSNSSTAVVPPPPLPLGAVDAAVDAAAARRTLFSSIWRSYLSDVIAHIHHTVYSIHSPYSTQYTVYMLYAIHVVCDTCQ